MKYQPVATMDTATNSRPRAQPRASVPHRRSHGKEKRGSRTYSSSEDDFYSDDNLRPYEEVKTAHHDKKLNGLDCRSVSECGSCKRPSWYMVDDQDQVYGYPKQLLVIPYGEGLVPEPSLHAEAACQTANVSVHHSENGQPMPLRHQYSLGQPHSTRPQYLLVPNETTGYVSGSDGDVDSDNPHSPSTLPKHQQHHGSQSSVSSEENPVNNVSQLSLSESDQDNTVATTTLTRPSAALYYHCSGTLPLPPPSFPPPPPPPIEDIPQRGQNAIALQRQLSFGPSVRGNYSEADCCMRRGQHSDLDSTCVHRMNYSDETARRGNYSDGSCLSCGHYAHADIDIPERRQNPYSEGDLSDFEPHYLVQTASGNVFIPPADAQPRFPRTVPRSGSLPTGQRSDIPSPNGMRPLVADTVPRQFPPNAEQANIVLNGDRHTCVHQQPFCGTPTVAIGYPHPMPQDYLYYSKFSSTKHQWKKKLQQRCSWRCFALILLFLCVALLACVAYFAVTKLMEEKEKVADKVESDDKSLAVVAEYTTTASPTLPTLFMAGEQQEQKIPAKSFWKTQFIQTNATYVKFNFSIPKNAIIGVYLRRAAQPTIAQFDFFEVMDGRTIDGRAKRAVTKETRDTALTKFLKSGPWFLAVYNDAEETRTVSFKSEVNYEMKTGCPGDCYGHGDCINGQCHCYPGYTRKDCMLTTCPVLCNDNGIYARGVCQCRPGWKGRECEIRENECEVPNCNGNGQCVDGKCMCHAGFQGPDCGIEICRLECMHGYCKNQKCNCEEGWGGALCDQLKCDTRCDGVRGYCNNGTCECRKGWNGKHCSMDGCHNDCSNNGACQKLQEGWICSCRDGWKGTSCDVPMETQCQDHTDNDGDGLNDCLDPDCCTNIACKDNMYCRTSPDPAEILLRKQPPSTTASFYEKMRFLIEDNSVQKDTSKNAFNESQVSVIRGRVITKDGTPLIGVKVDVVRQPLYGFTLTREQGVFDILVNGGGSVTLEFTRQPFLTKKMSVLVPWNQIITMETVTMVLKTQDEGRPDPTMCGITHEHYLLQPVVLSTWQHTQLGACPDKSTIIPESQVLQESIQIPGTEVHLVYHSSETIGYKSIVLIQITPQIIPPTLILVHLQVSVEGIRFDRTFEADPGLKYTFAWDRRNAYRQKVYGIVPARVNVGYQYTGCDFIFWEARSTTMTGFDLTSSEIGAWNLDLHHTYNFQEGILHKGDGTNIYLKEKPKKLVSILGSGQRRRADCDGCNGRAVDNRLLAPVALASGRDGSLYVWDYNFIRKLSPGREEIASILQIGTYTSHKPYMTVSPVDGRLYISDYMNRRIIRVKTMGPVRDLQDNFEVVAGTGEECTPGDRDICGDGKSAIMARFLHPKGIAINKEGVIYIADGPNIRVIDNDQKVHTLIGSQDQPRSWKPMSCDVSMPAQEVRLQWPTALAIDPLDDALHILDDNIVLKITEDNRVVTVAGRPINCPQKDFNFLPSGVLNDDEQASSIAIRVKLVAPESIAFGPQGELYIVESDTHHINRVRLVTTDGRIHHYVGTKSKCDCQRPNCRCYDPTESLAAQALFQELTSITITPDGIVHFADSGNLRVFSVISELPVPNWMSQYEVISTETQELYIFNRYGQHQHTVNIMTDQYMYNFTYNVNSFYGKLVGVTDSSGKTIQIERDYDLQAREIISPTGAKRQLLMDNMQRLQRFQASNNHSALFTYDAGSGLLLTKYLSDGKSFVYRYDEMGRLLSISQPTGETTLLQTDVNATDAAETKVTYLPDGAVVVVFPSNLTVSLETGGHPLLENQHRMHFKRKVIAPNMLVHRLEWRFYLRRKGRAKDGKQVQKTGRRMRVGAYFSRHASMLDSHDGGYKEKALLINGENLLTIEYDRDTHTETILDKDLHEIITVVYDESGLPISILPARNHHPLNITYNTAGEVTQFSYGDLQESKIYDKGLLKEKTTANGATFKYQYRYGDKPTDIHLPSGLQYYLEYDDQGNLMMIRTPGLGKHRFYRSVSFGIQRFSYQPPDYALPYILDYDGNGHILQIIYPSENRKVHFRYNRLSQPVRILHDETEITIGYKSEISMISSTDVYSRGYHCAEKFEYQSSLIESYEVSFPDDYRLLGASFHYEYDNNFRLTRMTSVFSQKNITFNMDFTFDDNTGKLKSMKSLNFQWPLSDRQRIFDEHITIIKEHDMYGRLQSVQYMFKNNIRFKMQLNYDQVNRILGWNRVIGQTDTATFEYRYDIDSNLIEVIQDGAPVWSYGYDNNGNIIRIKQYGINLDLEYDIGDRMRKFNERWYKFDQDGFLIQRHDEDLMFDANGQLLSLSRSGSYKYSYFYDSRGRLVVQRDRVGNIMQYFYADVSNVDHITHTYNHTNLEMTQYFYNENEILIGFERHGKLHYVATDPMGSPLVVFDENGLIIKQIGYDPLGQIMTDSNPNFEFTFGFQGGIYNPVTQMVHFRSRVYDTNTGRWTSPNYQDILINIHNVVEDPTMMNLYQHQELVNMHLRKRKYPPTDLTDWLDLLGYDLRSLSPEVAYDGTVRPRTGLLRGPQLLPVSSAFECTFHRDMNNMLSVSTVPQSKISPKQGPITTSPAPVEPLFGSYVIISAENNEMRMKFLENTPSWSKKIVSILLKHSEILDLRYNVQGRDILYLVKPDSSVVNDELKQLGIQGTTDFYERKINVTVNRLSHQDGFRMHAYNEVDVRLHGNYSVINIRYGSTYDHERQRVLRHAKERAVHRAWLREKWLIQNSLPTYHTWTEQEHREILTGGYAEGFDVEYIRSGEDYPELADDCNNVRFVKAKR
ncbi:hypothetical protein CHS0354_039985 [Potamilus streckersoni]|uniref:EGF-like domain-containing protein n=1 Tax=Potamilus streckersoni TaxID=2493646 RepID=A0AAE0VN55_9BIVA|nr:hypothetical protein CHS0354_039985 [Potamilus streckersoni]